MKSPKIAIVSFPGNNSEVESMRSIRNAGMEPVFFRWNDDRSKLKDVDGYFIVGGFSYEDRGRSGMVAGRDPLLEFIGQEAETGKVVIGNCNGAQILVESGLIPLGRELQMSLARNAIEQADGWHTPGFLSEWIWITPSCSKDRCATSNWNGTMHLPIAHGEGRFTTKDKDLIQELRKNNQIAFSYCDENGTVSNSEQTTPNGSSFAIAGICNPAGNVIAIMPHPERTPNGAPYFASIKKWIEVNQGKQTNHMTQKKSISAQPLESRQPMTVEIFIESIITNNEERTVEQIAKKFAPSLHLKQMKYFGFTTDSIQTVLRDLSLYNFNKERAYIRRGTKLTRWNSAMKTEEEIDEFGLFNQITLLRRDEPDTGGIGEGNETGVCYICSGIDENDLKNQALMEVFYNSNASTLERL